MRVHDLVAVLVLVSTGAGAEASETDGAPAPTHEHEAATAWTDVSADRLPLTALGGRTMDVEAADLDADGDLDLVGANEWAPNILMLNDGTGRFVDASDRLPDENLDSEDIALADFDGDGDVDVVFVTEDNQRNEYYLNDGTAHFENASDRLPAAGTTNAVVAADLDADGDLDLILGNAGQNVLLVNDGTGRFADETADRLPHRIDVTQDLELGDLDADGDLDLVVANEDDNRILIDRGGGHFTDESSARLPVPSGVREETREADLGDVDGDGDLDLFFANVDFQGGSENANRLLLNDGSGVFTDVSATHLPVLEEHSVDGDFADLDRDGDLDLVIGNAFGGPVRVLVNDGSGRLEDRSSGFVPADLAVDVIDVEVLTLGDQRVVYLANFRGPDVLLRDRQGR